MKLDLLESEHIEFKSKVSDSVVKTVAAFANCDGGKIYIGVSDEGDLLGIDDIDEELLRLTNMLRAHIRPDVLMMVSTEVESFGEKRIIVVTVRQGPKRPYYIASKGLKPEGVFIRKGAATVPSSDTAIIHMIRESEGESFESLISIRQDLTFDYAKNYVASKNLQLGTEEMQTLGMRQANGQYTNLAFLLSDQCPAFIKVAAFQDDDRNVFTAREEYSGSLFLQMESAYQFLESHLHFVTHYEGLSRIDIDDYPKEALREAVVNAVAHREYALSGPTLISIMPSSISMVSLGGLVRGLTYEDLYANISMPRNGMLASLLYRLGIIEAWGTGIGRMRAAYGKQNDAVLLSITPNTFTVSLANRNADVLPLFDNVHLSDKETVYQAIKSGRSTRVEIQNVCGFSQSKTIDLLRELQEIGRIERAGGSRNIHYVIK